MQHNDFIGNGYDSLKASLFIEIGDEDIVLDIGGRVFKEDVFDIEGTFIINDRNGNELASMDVNDNNIKFVSKFLKRDLVQELYEDAYRWN